MKTLNDPALLSDWMTFRQYNGGQLGRLAGVSRQFIHQLRTGARTSCTDAVAEAIERALMIPPGALFREGRQAARPKIVKTAA